ncbi:alpha/beta hydrolase [Pelagicoccus albus]|nr:alpha/beta hydrolase [Pelagicoccus albus]
MSLSSPIFANPLILPLWAETPPNHQESELEETNETSGEFTLIAKVQTPTIEVRKPSPANSIRRAVVICPGGGYGFLAYDWEGVDIASYLNGQGITAIILKYRLPEDASNIEPHKTPLLDAKRALRLAKANAEAWGYDTVGIMGFSAGGHLASTLGTHFDLGDPSQEDRVEKFSSRPDFMVLLYPVISMIEGITHAGSRENLIGEAPSEDLINFYSNELQVTPETPPTFLLHSSDDETVPVANSLRFYQALLENDIETEMHLYPYGGHGYSLAIGKDRLSQWPELCARWIREVEL